VIIFVCDIHLSFISPRYFAWNLLFDVARLQSLVTISWMFSSSNCLPFPKPIATGNYLPHLNLVFFVAIFVLVVVACLLAKKRVTILFLCVCFFVAKKIQAPCCVHHIITFLVHCNQKKGGHHPPCLCFLQQRGIRFLSISFVAERNQAPLRFSSFF